MELRDTEGYIFIGTAVRYLMDCGEGAALFTEGAIVENINLLHRQLLAYEFHVSYRVAQPLVNMRESWNHEAAEHESEPGWRDSRTLTASEFEELRTDAHHLRETMLAEAQGKVAFIATDKRFSVDKLLNDIGSLMAPGVFDGLPDLAKFDFEEAGKALAFDLPTAAAFHILRGTEAVLRNCYERVVRRGRIAEPWLWHAMVQDMRGKRNAPADLVLGNLDSLRRHFRNPTQHPEKVYDMDECQDLLALAVDSVNRVRAHLVAKHL